MGRISISDERTSLNVEVRGYEREVARDPDDANWLIAEIAVEALPFRGRFALGLTTHDLTALRTRVECLLAGEEVPPYETTEGDISLTMSSSPSGRVKVLVRLQREGRSFDFEMDCNQGTMRELADQVTGVLKEYPVRGPVGV